MNRTSTIRIAATAVAVALALASAPAIAGPKKPNKGPERAQARVEAQTRSGVSVSVGLEFDDARRLAVRHGYTGWDSLPRGIQKRLAEGKPLPPGIAKKTVPTPMLRELPAHPGHEWRVCGADLVLVAERSGIVARVYVDLFR